MEHWNLYFWLTLFVTFAVTALSVRIWPLRGKSESYYGGKGVPEPEYRERLLHHARRIVRVQSIEVAHEDRAIERAVVERSGIGEEHVERAAALEEHRQRRAGFCSDARIVDASVHFAQYVVEAFDLAQ